MRRDFTLISILAETRIALLCGDLIGLAKLAERMEAALDHLPCDPLILKDINALAQQNVILLKSSARGICAVLERQSRDEDLKTYDSSGHLTRVKQMPALDQRRA